MTGNSKVKVLKDHLYLFLLPLFFVLSQYNQFPGVVTIRDALVMALIYFLLMLVFRIIFYLCGIPAGKSSVLSVIYSIIFLFFGFFHDGLKATGWEFISRYSILMPALFILGVVIFMFIRKSNSEFKKLNRFFLILFAVLSIYELVIWSDGKTTPATSNGLASCDTCQKPDIYFILADEYAGKQQLKEVFGYDNAPFLDALRARGFFMMEDSRSNYNSTSYSMASILSMNYLELHSVKENQQDIDANLFKIETNPLVPFLVSQGYQFYNHSVFKIANEHPPHSSQFFIRGKRRIHYQTLAGRLEKDLRFHLITNLKWQWQLEQTADTYLEQTKEIFDLTRNAVTDSITRPKFVYTHLMMPHFPYLLDSNGRLNDLDHLATEDWTDKSEYLGYLHYSNKRFLELIDYILINARRPSIIILMSDHGFRYLEKKSDNHPYHFMNLNAIYFPGSKNPGYNNGMSAVNQFRVLLNAYFNQSLPPLKDSTIFIH